MVTTLKPPTLPVTTHTLPHGLTLVHHYMPATPVVVVDVWVGAGAGVEPPQWSGIAHFLEHMVFKGNDQLMPGVFDQVVENRGGASNAATSYDYAHYYMTLAADDLPETLPFLAELVLRAGIPADEFVRERQVVLEELRQAQDDPDWVGHQALCAQVYEEHPYGRSILGTEAQLMALSPEDMRRFHQAHYQPGNMTVVVAGGISLEPTLALINHTFRAFPTPAPCPKTDRIPVNPWRGVRRQTLRLPRLEQPRLMMAWLGPGVDNLADACAMDLLSSLLAEGRTSRLVRELREERQWVRDIYSSFSLQREASLFTFQVWLEADRLEAVEGLICDRLAQMGRSPIPPAELARAKRLLCNDFAFSTETPGQLSGLYGYYQTIATTADSYRYVSRVEAHTSESVAAAARRWLSPENYAVTLLLPEDC